MNLLDVSRPIQAATPVWPGDEPFRLDWTSRTDEGGLVNVARIHCGVHTATHLDAPLHLRSDGAAIDMLVLDRFVGPVRIVDVAGEEVIDGAIATRALRTDPSPTRVLFRSGAWSGGTGFPTRYPAIDPAAADLLRRGGVILVGTDAPSVDPFESPDLPAHRILLGAGICILENLLLDAALPGDGYEIIALPLRIVGADASPVRAVLRPL